MDEMDQLSKVRNTDLLFPELEGANRHSTSKIFALCSASEFSAMSRFKLSDRFFC